MPEDSLLRPASMPFRRDPPATIGLFAVRAASNELAGPDGVVRLRPRLMDVLLRLAAARGEVVPRQVPLDDVWPRRLVADEVLSRTIAELRIALRDDARESSYIETLPKIGYRLIAPLTPIARAASAVAAGPATPNAPAGADEQALATCDMPSSAAGAPAPGNAIVAGTPTAATAFAATASGTFARSRRDAPARSSARRFALAAVLAAVLVAGTLAMVAWRDRRAADTATTARGIEQQLAVASPFSSELEMETSPRFSRDGKRVAFALGDAERSSIVVQDVASGSRTEFGGRTALLAAPVFFPDGQRLAYFRRDGTQCGIYARDLASGAEQSVVTCADRPGARFDLSPDGTVLVYAATREGDTGLRSVDLATRATTRLTTPAAAAGLDVFPRFSPDGKRAAYMHGATDARETWVLPLAAPADARMVGVARGLSYGLAWMADAGPLLVAADWTGFRALNTLDLASGAVTMVGARGAQFPDISRQGEVVYEVAAYQANLRLLDTADPTRAPRTLWPSARYTNFPAFAPNGRHVAFMSNRDNAASVFVGELDGPARRLPLPAGALFVRFHWSHDGRFLYAVRGVANDDEAPQYGVRIDAATGGIEVLAALGSDINDVRDSADGRLLYFGTREAGSMRLWRAPVDALERRERLALPVVEEYDLRGARLAYTAAGQPDIVACDLPALACAPRA